MEEHKAAVTAMQWNASGSRLLTADEVGFQDQGDPHFLII
jgi:hypothetical protein